MIVAIAGCGSVGSRVANMLAQRENITLVLLDDDVVEESNLGTSAYRPEDVGKLKVNALRDICEQYGAKVVTQLGTVDSKDYLNAHDVDLLVDCFDNVDARSHTVGTNHIALHLGVGTQGNGMVFWDDDYELPEKTFERGNNPICTNALGVRLIRKTALAGVEAVEEFIASLGESKVSRLVAEGD